MLMLALNTGSFGHANLCPNRISQRKRALDFREDHMRVTGQWHSEFRKGDSLPGRITLSEFSFFRGHQMADCKIVKNVLLGLVVLPGSPEAV